MAIIKVAGTAKDQKVYLCLSRKPEGSLQTHEYEHRNQAGELKEFRKKLPNNELKGLTINRVKIDKYENTNGVSYPVTLFVTHRTGTHILNFGSGGPGKSAANSILSLANMTDEQIARATVDVSFYTKKDDGKNAVSVKINGERAEWVISKEEKDALVDVSTHKGKTLVDDTKYCEALMQLADGLNPRLPKSSHNSEDALDSFFGDAVEEKTESSIDTDFPDEVPVSEVEVPKSRPPVAEEITFV